MTLIGVLWPIIHLQSTDKFFRVYLEVNNHLWWVKNAMINFINIIQQAIIY